MKFCFLSARHRQSVVLGNRCLQQLHEISFAAVAQDLAEPIFHDNQQCCITVLYASSAFRLRFFDWTRIIFPLGRRWPHVQPAYTSSLSGKKNLSVFVNCVRTIYCSAKDTSRTGYLVIPLHEPCVRSFGHLHRGFQTMRSIHQRLQPMTTPFCTIADATVEHNDACTK